MLEKNLIAAPPRGTASCRCSKNGKGRHRPTFWSWQAMMRRCNDPKFSAYPNYGGRGIRVSREWSDVVTGYDAFVLDMGERPPGMTLDRRSPDDDYNRKTCRWAPRRVQEWNKRGRKMHEEDAEEEAYWCQEEQNYLTAQEQELLAEDQWVLAQAKVERGE